MERPSGPPPLQIVVGPIWVLTYNIQSIEEYRRAVLVIYIVYTTNVYISENIYIEKEIKSEYRLQLLGTSYKI